MVAVDIAEAVIATKPCPSKSSESLRVRPGSGQQLSNPMAEPRSGKALILATKAYAKEDRLKSWWVVLSTLALFGSLLVGTLAPWAWPARLLCSLVMGLVMVRVFVIFHDHQHHAILDRSFVADFLMRFIGILSLTPSSIWKSSHNYHHNHNSKIRSANIGSFPIMTRTHYAEASFRKRFMYRFTRHPLTILAGYPIVFFIDMALLSFIQDPRRHLDGLLAVVLHLSFGVTLYLYGGFLALFLSMLLPFTIAMALGTLLFYVQHNFPDVHFRDSQGWTYEGAALDSSSYLKMPRLMHWFTANIGYHHIHHLNSRIPFYRLPEAMNGLPELQNPKSVQLNLRDMVACLRLCVWDVEAQRMIPLPKKAAR